MAMCDDGGWLENTQQQTRHREHKKYNIKNHKLPTTTEIK